jgi:small subunit ribosomal protein S3
MGQKVRPTGFRTGIMQTWGSSWYANKQDFSELLVEDFKIRKFIATYLGRHKERKESRPMISKVKIERTRERVIVTIYSSKVGAIIGKKGDKIEKLTKALEKLTRRHIDIKTVEVVRPEIDPQLVGEEIAEQLEKRASFRRTMKNALQRAMDNGAKGIKVQLSGRLGGAEMARCEKAMDGSIPLSTLRAKVDFGFSEANTPQGNIGIKVWINNGDFVTGEINDATDAQAGQVSKKPARRRKG